MPSTLDPRSRIALINPAFAPWPPSGSVSALAALGGGVCVDDFGAVGDGVTDDTVAIQRAEDVRGIGESLFFTPGKVYAIPTLNAKTSIRVNKPGNWQMNGATLKYTGVANVTTGTDGAAIPLLAVLATPFSINFGTLDGNTHCTWLVGIQGAQNGGCLFQFATIQNNLETTSSWCAIAYTVSRDVSGIAISGARANNVSGIISRPNCPQMDNTGAITIHVNLSGLLVGGSAIWGNTTGFAIVAGGGTETDLALITCGALAVPQFISNVGAAIVNNVLLDLMCYDLGCRRQERYGAVLDVPQRQSFGVGGAYTPGWLENTGGLDANVHVITVTANVAVTIANPTNGAGIGVDRVGRLLFMIRNTSGGALGTAVTFTGAAYRVSGTVSPANNQQIAVAVEWDQTTGLYYEVWRSAAVAL